MYSCRKALPILFPLQYALVKACFVQESIQSFILSEEKGLHVELQTVKFLEAAFYTPQSFTTNTHSPLL